MAGAWAAASALTSSHHVTLGARPHALWGTSGDSREGDVLPAPHFPAVEASLAAGMGASELAQDLWAGTGLTATQTKGRPQGSWLSLLLGSTAFPNCSPTWENRPGQALPGLEHGLHPTRPPACGTVSFSREAQACGKWGADQAQRPTESLCPTCRLSQKVPKLLPGSLFVGGLSHVASSTSCCVDPESRLYREETPSAHFCQVPSLAMAHALTPGLTPRVGSGPAPLVWSRGRPVSGRIMFCTASAEGANAMWGQYRLRSAEHR